MNKLQIAPKGNVNTAVVKRFPQALIPLVTALVFLLLIGCSTGVDDQATADQMTGEAAALAERNQAATEEAEMMEATMQAHIAANETLEAANLEAEQEAMARATADSQATEEAREAANEQATAEALAAAEAQATAEAMETVMAQSTAEAEALATASFEATQEAYKRAQLDLITDAQDKPVVVDMVEGALVHDEDGEPEMHSTEVDLRNFVIQTKFAVEVGESDLDHCDFGLGFRSGEDEVTYLLLSDDGSWQLIASNNGDDEVIQEGQSEPWRDGWNEVALYIDEESGFFALNHEYVDELDLDQSPEKGDIVLVTGMGEDMEADGASIAFKELQVWSMDPIPPTPTPAPISDSPPPPPVVSGHTFPETPIKSFDRDEFVSYVGQLRDSLRSYTSEMNLMNTTHKPGDCGTFYGWLDLWRRRSPGYTEVPSSFASLYGEYRDLLRQVVQLSEEIRLVCDAGGGFVSDETINGINAFLSWAYPRSEQMVSEASVLPP